MKIYRGPRTSKRWEKIDTKKLKSWTKDWAPGKIVHVDGTIDKSGTRHTDLGIEIELHDIGALHNAFVRYHSGRVRDLEKENAKQAETIRLLEQVLGKIQSLARSQSNRAPSSEALMAAIASVAHHYRYAFYRDERLKDLPRWVGWQSL
jgi:hypothetical protein